MRVGDSDNLRERGIFVVNVCVKGSRKNVSRKNEYLKIKCFYCYEKGYNKSGCFKMEKDLRKV